MTNEQVIEKIAKWLKNYKCSIEEWNENTKLYWIIDAKNLLQDMPELCIKAEMARELIEEIRQCKNLMYFTTHKLHPEGTNTISHCIDDEAIEAIVRVLSSKMEADK